MISHATTQEVLQVALSQGGSFAELFLEDRLSHLLVMMGGTLETANTGRTHGGGIRIFHGNQYYYVYTNDTSREGLIRCAETAAAAIGSGFVQAQVQPVIESITPNAHAIRMLPGDVPGALKVESMRAAHAAAKDFSPEISQTSIRLLDWDQQILIANSEGMFKRDRRVYTRFKIEAVASSGMENQTGSQGHGAMRGMELVLEGIDPQALGRGAAEQAVTMLHAPYCPAGVMPVIIDNGFGGVIFHEACGHSLEAIAIAKNASEFAGKLGQRVAASCVTAIDDGLEPNAWGSQNIDDEGTPTQKITLIDKGILTSYMVDRFSGQKLGMASTGSGRRESYAYAPCSRMHNTYIAPGTDTQAEMFATMGDGLYAKHMGGGSVNPSTGEFNFAVSEGYLVKDGKIAHPVRGASLIGRGSEVLQKIDRVGSNLAFDQGMCGSYSSSVPTHVGQPMIRVSSITVGGK